MKKKCKRKHWALINPVTHALQGAQFIPDSELLALRTRELAAIEAFRTGSATLQEWSDIKAMLNLCEVMASNGVGPEALPTCKQAQAELIAAAKRFENTGKMGTSATGLNAFRDLYQFHDIQRQSICRQQYESFIAKVTNRVKSKAPEVVDVGEVV